MRLFEGEKRLLAELCRKPNQRIDNLMVRMGMSVREVLLRLAGAGYVVKADQAWSATARGETELWRQS